MRVHQIGRHSILTVAVVLAIGSPSAEGQNRPVDFSGTWVTAQEPTRKGEVKEKIVVTQDNTGMTATFGSEGPTAGETIRYEFGTTRTQTKSGPGGEITVRISSRWEGDTLVATNTVLVRDRERTFEQVWSRDATGNLVLKVTQQSGATPTPQTTVYRRVEEKKDF